MVTMTPSSPASGCGHHVSSLAKRRKRLTQPPLRATQWRGSKTTPRVASFRLMTCKSVPSSRAVGFLRPGLDIPAQRRPVWPFLLCHAARLAPKNAPERDLTHCQLGWQDATKAHCDFLGAVHIVEHTSVGGTIAATIAPVAPRLSQNRARLIRRMCGFF